MCHDVYMSHNASTCATWRIHTCDSSHSDVVHLHTCINMCYMTHPYIFNLHAKTHFGVCRNSFTQKSQVGRMYSFSAGKGMSGERENASRSACVRVWYRQRTRGNDAKKARVWKRGSTRACARQTARTCGRARATDKREKEKTQRVRAREEKDRGSARKRGIRRKEREGDILIRQTSPVFRMQ